MEKEQKNYNIGLDIGTESVGWCVSNPDFNLQKINGRPGWGVRIFSEGMPAADRRVLRSARRRMERRKERIRLLQMLTGDIVLKEDPSFFIRLRESAYYQEDRSLKGIYNLFVDADYDEKQYYKKYKTIYHLRADLIKKTEKAKAREIYLAIHHIIKYRGNFLYDGDISFNGGEIYEMFDGFFKLYNELTEIDLNKNNTSGNICLILLDKTLYKYKKIENIKALYTDKEEKDIIESLIKFLLGYKVTADSLFNITEEPIMEEEDKPLKMQFGGSDFEEKEDKYLSLLGEYADLLIELKAIYTSIQFYEILGSEQNISDAMIKLYEKHKEDKAKLKALVKNTDYYDQIFKATKGKNYLNYIKDKRGENKCEEEEFYKYLKGVLTSETFVGKEETNYILKEIDNGSFMPRLNTVKNGAIPYQMQKKELIKIIDNQGVYYPELLQNKDKIISLLTFKRPYYVGVLKLKPSCPTSWQTETVNEKIYPWNFNDKIDLDASQEKFIQNMLNYCSIYPEEEVLPRNSFYYNEFSVLQELNKIKLDNKPVSVDLKQCIYEGLFKQFKNITAKKLCNWLDKNKSMKVWSVSGLSDEEKFNNSLTSYIDFKGILGDVFSEKDIDKYESIVRVLTLFDDADTRFKRIKKIMPELSEGQVKQLSKLRYAGWGRYSKKVIKGVLSSDKRTVLNILYQTNENMMEIAFKKEYGFENNLQPAKKSVTRIDYEECIEDLYCSPVVKKGIWQCLLVIEDITKAMGCPPKHIYIEQASGEDKFKKRKDNRLKLLDKLYNYLKKDVDIYNQNIHNALKEKLRNNEKIDSMRIYLYFLQNGKCMYSGETLDIDNLKNYEIDHILPRSFIKDDSIDNKVLVIKEKNQRKKNLALDNAIVNKMSSYWSALVKAGLISKKKYENLTRGEYTAGDLFGFVNRQLVETRQTVKEVCGILGALYKENDDIEIRGIKAGLTDTFRTAFKLYKVRNLNDYHHAEDAYIISLVGNFMDTLYPYWGQDYRQYALGKLTEELEKNGTELSNGKYGFIINKMLNQRMDEFGEYVWIPDNIIKNFNTKSYYYSKKSEFLAEHAFYNQTIYGKVDNKELTPRKFFESGPNKGLPMPPEKYGGYSSIKFAYFVWVAYKKKNKLINELVNIPSMVVVQKESNPNALEDFLNKEIGEHIVIKDHINKGQLMLMEGQLVALVSQGEVNNATQLLVDRKYNRMLAHCEDTDKDKTEVDDNDIALMPEFIEYYLKKLKEHYPLMKKEYEKISNFISQGSFDSLTLELKIKFINAIMIITKSGAGRADMSKDFGMSSDMGRLSKAVIPDKVRWINRSPSGIYEIKE